MIYQKVKIKEDLNLNQEHIIKEMLKFKGKTSNVIEIIILPKEKKIYYILEIDNGKFIWDNTMLDTII